MYDVMPILATKAVDCGPTCLAMLLQYYGATYDMAQLVKECNVQLNGCTAKDLMRVGRAHGMDMKCYKTDAEGLYTADRPAIIWWKYSHFCVYCGLDENDQVVICNPDRGRYRMSKGLFASFYSGIAMSNGEIDDLPEDDE